uniref:ZAD domain-containing protein n=1 Tax=Anopheles christyi TaxID=43041 RepID=A0A182JQN1_9DIPT
MDIKDESQIEFTITSFSTCCRLCLSSNENEHYYDIYLCSLASNGEITFMEAIHRITNIELISNSKLPSKICKLCSARLDDAFCFIRDFHRTNEMLQNYLDNEEMDKEDGDDIDLSTVQELCELDLTHQQIAMDEEHENQCKGNKQCDNKSASNEPELDNESEDHAQSDGEKRTLTAVDLILQQITVPPSKSKRRTDKSTLKHHCTECDK